MVQKAVNAVRKAEAKELAATNEKWEAFQKSLKKSFIQERTKFMEKQAKLMTEQQEQEAAQAEALTELKEAFCSSQDSPGPSRRRQTTWL